MKKQMWFLCLTLVLLPGVALADALSFQPPTTDVSVIFLGNIFGIVDGVLSGTGSQIVGQMFAVFNSAVLALGGIVLLYVILVSTMNTANEGEMLGRKWSSIWVPLRLVIGMGLLVPKSTGYCLMQVLVMWVVVQGVGAADKVWNAALSYLNRGGVIIQAQMGSAQLMSGASSAVPKGAATMLSGQVCMIGLQNQLERVAKMIKDTGECDSSSLSGATKALCNYPVPNFLNSVNAVTAQQDQTPSAPGGSVTVAMPANFSVKMPNLTGNYSNLTGVCGTLQWNSVNMKHISGSGTSLSSAETSTVQQTRAIAVQQMYITLSSVAQAMVNNDPKVNGQDVPPSTTSNEAVQGFAIQQFGVPQSTTQGSCSLSDLSTCTSWGSTSDDSGAILFTGTEFQSAIADYNGIMAPTITLQAQGQSKDTDKSAKDFISKAESSGWIMAGSYFYNLAALNSAGMAAGTSSGGAPKTDDSSGLDKSTFPMNNLACSGNSSSTLCSYFKLNSSTQKFPGDVADLINGNMQSGGPVVLTTNFPPQNDSSTSPATGDVASTTYGYINNASMIQLPGQVGITPPSYKFELPLKYAVPAGPTPQMNINCESLSLFSPSTWICGLAKMLINTIALPVLGFFFSLVQQVINSILMAIVSLPLSAFGSAFNTALGILQTPNINPVITLAKMGSYYINTVIQIWIILAEVSITTMITSIPWPSITFIVGLILALVLPFIAAWSAVMMAIGFVTAYYVPILPYMIFTFGSIAWLIGVIEAMVAAPIVALGVTHPEGHEVLGKADQAVMLILNVFLRPAMMIIGYITAIALTYVGVWILNTGYDNAIFFMTSNVSNQNAVDSSFGGGVVGGLKNVANTGYSAASGATQGATTAINDASQAVSYTASQVGVDGVPTTSLSNPLGASPSFQAAYQSSDPGYVGWATMFAQFFGVLIYTVMYMTIVQRSFVLITQLPDKVLRWIGGQQESLGSESAQWAQQDVKPQMDKAGDKTQSAAGQSIQAGGQKLGQKAREHMPASSSAHGLGGGSGTDLVNQ